jgi:hypothetical protein
VIAINQTKGAQMGKHLHKRFAVQEVKEIFERYLSKEIAVEHVLALLKIGRRRFFDLIKNYRETPDKFSLEYKRKASSNRISEKAESKIMSELKKEASIIGDINNPVRDFNYSYLKEILEKKHKVSVSLPTIISRAKKMGFIRKRKSENRTTAKS